jgi:serine/threonine protein kinase
MFEDTGKLNEGGHTPPNPAVPELRLPGLKESSFDVGSKYITQRVIGKGAFGFVVSAECCRTGTKVAIKKIKNATSDRIAALRLLREMRFLRALRGHPNVINIQDVLVSPSQQVFSFLLACNDDQNLTLSHSRSMCI